MKAIVRARPSLTRALAWAAIVVGVVARVFSLVVRPLWADEIFTLTVARKSAPEILAALRVDSGPPLHYLLRVRPPRAVRGPGPPGRSRARPLPRRVPPPPAAPLRRGAAARARGDGPPGRGALFRLPARGRVRGRGACVCARVAPRSPRLRAGARAPGEAAPPHRSGPGVRGGRCGSHPLPRGLSRRGSRDSRARRAARGAPGPRPLRARRRRARGAWVPIALASLTLRWRGRRGRNSRARSGTFPRISPSALTAGRPGHGGARASARPRSCSPPFTRSSRGPRPLGLVVTAARAAPRGPVRGGCARPPPERTALVFLPFVALLLAAAPPFVPARRTAVATIAPRARLPRAAEPRPARFSPGFSRRPSERGDASSPQVTGARAGLPASRARGARPGRPLSVRGRGASGLVSRGDETLAARRLLSRGRRASSPSFGRRRDSLRASRAGLRASHALESQPRAPEARRRAPRRNPLLDVVRPIPDPRRPTPDFDAAGPT